MSSGVRGLAIAAAMAGAASASRGALAGLRRHPPGGAARWVRTNHAGRTVSLVEGPALVFGCAAGAGAGRTARHRIAALVAVGAAGFAGLVDDLKADVLRADDLKDAGVAEGAAVAAPARGFAGHLSALRAGRVTTGAVKLVTIGAAGLAAGALACRPGTGPAQRAVAGALVAGTANLVNLFDLRPGRAGKVTLLAALPLALSSGDGAPLAAGLAGAVAGVLPDDLAGRTMAGDTGANAAGALLGVALATSLSPGARLGALAAVGALTASSEAVSFSRVIDAVPALRWFDRLGRSGGGP